MVSQMHLNYAQAKNAYAMAALNFAQEAGVRINNRLQDSILICLLVWLRISILKVMLSKTNIVEV